MKREERTTLPPGFHEARPAASSLIDVSTSDRGRPADDPKGDAS